VGGELEAEVGLAEQVCGVAGGGFGLRLGVVVLGSASVGDDFVEDFLGAFEVAVLIHGFGEGHPGFAQVGGVLDVVGKEFDTELEKVRDGEGGFACA
jgi:hypothetical protein